jgi:outer membrane biosynthesis protein TonB
LLIKIGEEKKKPEEKKEREQKREKKREEKRARTEKRGRRPKKQKREEEEGVAPLATANPQSRCLSTLVAPPTTATTTGQPFFPFVSLTSSLPALHCSRSM